MLSYTHTLRAHAAGEPVTDALRLDYAAASDAQLATAYASVAKGLAVVEENPRGTLGPTLRRHLNIIVDEQQNRGEVMV
jgi:hypothetical protein